ncbi:MAG: conjugal transfer protein TraL [Gammaproteobacteria bacterium]|nr:conjugal transfer protein TraL [Gammaproteobacteria bacterium]
MTDEKTSSKQPKKIVHFVLQGKGGCGKTVSSVMLAQVLRDRGTVECYDTDPVNATFSQYKGISATSIELLNSDQRIDARQFDVLLENLLNSQSNHVIVDTGSQSFLELSSYMVESNALDYLAEEGIEVFAHVIVVGGAAIADTFTGLGSVLESFPNSCKITIWQNEFFGPVEYQGKQIADMNIYKENAARIHAIVRLPKENPQTTERDICEMLQHHETFDEAIAADRTLLMAKRRLKSAKERIYDQVAAVV